jgi:small subunit ribosomal protein S6
MTRLYEGMFLIDNEAVRAGWAEAKATVGRLISKHGGKVETARRWAERRLAYPIAKRKRATFLLAYVDLQPERMRDLVRDLDINETVLRYLLLGVEAVPDTERELAASEESADFTVPEPPSDDTEDLITPRLGTADDDDDDEPRGRRSPRRSPRSEDEDEEDEPALAGSRRDEGKED